MKNRNLLINLKDARTLILYGFLSFLLILGGNFLFAGQLYSPTWAYYLDMPEGFVLSEKQGTENYQFEHSMFPISLVITAYPKTRYTLAKQCLEESLKKLNAKHDLETFRWNNTDSALSLFSMNLNGQPYTGWAAACPLSKQEGIALILAYSPAASFEQYQQLIVSAIDSFSADKAGLRKTGIITSFAYQNEGEKESLLTIAGIKIPVLTDKIDISANKFVIEREHAVLKLFADTAAWKEAWQRYYRMIYRDAYQRLSKAAFSVYNALYEKVEQDYPENPERGMAQTLLSWVQSFPYERQLQNTDFTPLPALLERGGSDCDSRALLLALLMSQMNYKTMIFLSAEYSHAFFGVEVSGSGARIKEAGTAYLLGETTAQVDIGLVPADMNDTSKWIAVSGLNPLL